MRRCMNHTSANIKYHDTKWKNYKMCDRYITNMTNLLDYRFHLSQKFHMESYKRENQMDEWITANLIFVVRTGLGNILQ